MGDEKAPTKEITIITPENPPAWLTEVPSDQRVVVNVGWKRGAEVKYSTYWQVPVTDEQAKARYNVSLAELAAIGVRQIAYGTDNKPAFGPNGECDHAVLQKQADEYKRGQRGTGKSAVTKKKASEFDTACGMFGIDPTAVDAADQLRNAIKALQSGKKKK